MTGDDTLRGRLRLCGIGGFALMRDGAPIRLRNRKAQALIALLALSAPARLSREKIADLLWSGSALDQARQSLRQSLHDIRRALGGEAAALIEAGRAELALAEHSPRLDALSLLDAVATEPAPPPVDWAALTLFPGLEEVDPEFGDWLDQRRRAFTERLAETMEARMATAEGEAQAGWARALVALDPAHEPACRALMGHDAARGDLRAALRRYAALWELLDEELAVEPSPETQELAVKLKSTQTVDAAPFSDVERPSLTLFVPDYRTDGVPEDRAYLVRGFRRDLIASLTCYREWVVIEPDEDAELPREDGSYALEGAGFPRDCGVRINTTLKDAMSRRFIWGEQDIPLEMDNWFDACQRTTRRLAAALDIKVSGERLARRRNLPDDALPLYDKLLLARDLMTKWEPEAEARAESIFRAVLARNPAMHRARLGLAQILSSRHIVFPGAPFDNHRIKEALGFAQVAAEADPLDSEAQLALGWSLALSGQPGEAIKALHAACENNPTHPRTLASAADGLAQCGEATVAHSLEQTVTFLERNLSRLSCAYFTSGRFLSGDYAGAAEMAERARWNIPLGGGWQAAALALDGRIAEAGLCFRDWASWLRARWTGETAPSDAVIARWCVAAPPIADPARRALLEKGLAIACGQRQDEKV